jgi:lipid-A-disaccharide synthase
MSTIYIVAGEASGDARGSELMRAMHEIAPQITFRGAGGPEMRAIAGGDFVDWAGEAVVGLWDVLKKYGYFRKQFNRILGDIDEVAPKALILIDYPGFNLRLADAIRTRRPEIKIIYYISPQVWAWNQGRIPKMAEYLDLMLCIFPFEQPLYEASGLKTEFVGHPMLDSLAAKKIPDLREERLVGLFPGSRDREVRKIFPTMLAAAARMDASEKAAGNSPLVFEAAAASEPIAAQMRALLKAAEQDEQWCRVTVGASHELMQRATLGMVASGTATLEAAYFGMPLVILYKVAWLTWAVGKRLVRVPFLGMPNILAQRAIVREFLQGEAKPDAIAGAMLRLLRDPNGRAELQVELQKVIAGLGETGAGTRAARVICRELDLATP